jgi:hypothetical protein
MIIMTRHNPLDSADLITVKEEKYTDNMQTKLTLQRKGDHLQYLNLDYLHSRQAVDRFHRTATK